MAEAAHSSTIARSCKAPLQRPGVNASRAAPAAVLLGDARFQRAREPVERLVDRARRAVRGYARHGDRGVEFIGEPTRKVDRMVAERQRAGPLRRAKLTCPAKGLAMTM